jgi:DNA-directed RNA polymerase subunit M/transcription elongation factor TFIIS
MSYSPDGFSILELRAERLGRFNLIKRIARARDDAERGYMKAEKEEKEDYKIRCPNCKSKHIVKYGYRMTRKGRKQKYHCEDCGYTFIKR